MIMERVRDGEKKSWEGKAGWLCGTKEGKKKGSRKEENIKQKREKRRGKPAYWDEARKTEGREITKPLRKRKKGKSKEQSLDLKPGLTGG